MRESFTSDIQALFPKGEQRSFLEVVEKQTPLFEIARICRCSERTIRDWRKEKFPMQKACIDALCAHARIPVPENIKTRSRYSHVRTAGLKGARTVMKKYGRVPVNETTRLEQWRTWWKTKGKDRKLPILQELPIKRPKQSIELAEFIGIMLGDGGMSRYQAVITLHHTDDLAYSKYVAALIKKLFALFPRIYHYPKSSVNDITISRIGIVRYLHERGLPVGNKIAQQVDIPDWIKKDRRYAIACLRGLVDTDGTVFTHSYVVKAKRYSYKKLIFTSRSQPLQLSVAQLLTDIGISVRISGYDVCIDSRENMKKYFDLVGSHNSKHLKRYAGTVG